MYYTFFLYLEKAREMKLLHVERRDWPTGRVPKRWLVLTRHAPSRAESSPGRPGGRISRPPRQEWGLESPAREKADGQQKQFSSGDCSGQAFGAAEVRCAFGQRPLDVAWRLPHVRRTGG